MPGEISLLADRLVILRFLVIFNKNAEVGLRRFLSVGFFWAGLVMAGGANATPIKWTIPNTTLSSFFGSVTSGSVSGTFVWDADTSTASNVHISVVLNGGAPTLISSTAPSKPGVAVFTRAC
jgi:hypothetical protein